MQDGTVHGQTRFTAISDNEGALTWTPGMAPSNAGNPAVDGTLTVVPAPVSQLLPAGPPVTQTKEPGLPKVIVPLKRIVPVASPTVGQRTQAETTASANRVPTDVDTASLAAESIIGGVSASTSSVFLVQPEAFVTTAAIDVSPTPSSDLGSSVTTAAKSSDSGAALSLAAQAANKLAPVASAGSLNVKTPASALDEVFRQLGVLAAYQVNGNQGVSSVVTTEDWSDVWDFAYLMADQTEE
jgi:hypothetical protein